RQLLESCGTQHAEECSDVIFRALWASVRRDADPNLVQALDCQFAQIDAIRIDPYGYYQLRLGAVLADIQRQIDEQPSATGDCSKPPRLAWTGDPDLGCWTRAEFSKERAGAMTLSMLLSWISWRNGFSVEHHPPEIWLVFHKQCAW